MGVSHYDAQWLLPEIVDSSPLVWFVEVDGYLMDMRRAPVGLHIAAYERGFIPYVPALRQEEKKREAKEPDPQPAPAPEKKAEAPVPPEPAPPEPADYSDIYRAFGAEGLDDKDRRGSE